jgi:hypothetical protein
MNWSSRPAQARRASPRTSPTRRRASRAPRSAARTSERLRSRRNRSRSRRRASPDLPQAPTPPPIIPRNESTTQAPETSRLGVSVTRAKWEQKVAYYRPNSSSTPQANLPNGRHHEARPAPSRASATFSAYARTSSAFRSDTPSYRRHGEQMPPSRDSTFSAYDGTPARSHETTSS